MIWDRLPVLLLILSLTPLVRAQTTQPAGDPRVELRANQAFNRGEYSVALPLLKKLADQARDEPSRFGSIQERIRVCEKAMASFSPSADPQSILAAQAGASDVPMDSEHRHKHPAPKSGETVDLSIKELGNFDYDSEHGGNIPADVKHLSGAKVQLKGYMIPMDQAENITQFALVPSLFACCFGQPPQIQHTIVVNCPKGKAVPYCPDEIVVLGELKVDEKKDDGYVVSIFEIRADSVKAAPAKK